jgi:hypothetical protein
MKICVLQRSQDSQFYFSNILDDSKEFQSLPKIKIEPIQSVRREKQPRLSKHTSRTTSKSKERLLFCSFAPITTVGNYTLQDCSIDTLVDIGTSDVVEGKVYSGNKMEKDVDFKLDISDEIDTTKGSLNTLQVNALILLELQELASKRGFEDPSDLELHLGILH